VRLENENRFGRAAVIVVFAKKSDFFTPSIPAAFFCTAASVPGD
jgi:hypothetical protein